jgi:hypothetical protein
MPKRFEIVRELLDKQIVGNEEKEMGRADGVVLELREGKPPRVDHLELGFVVLAHRLHPGLETWLNALRKRWSVRRVGRQAIPWSSVKEVKQHHVEVDVNPDPTPAYDWERWLRRNVVHHLPGGEEK